MSNSRSVRLGRERTALTGIDKRLANVSTLMLDGTSFTPATLKQLIQSHLDAAAQVDPAKAAYSTAVQQEHTLGTRVTQVLRALRDWIVAQYGAKAAAPIPVDLGFTVTAKHVPTTVTKAAAVSKRAATRTARNTKGPRKRLQVKAQPAAAGGSPKAPSGS